MLSYFACYIVHSAGGRPWYRLLACSLVPCFSLLPQTEQVSKEAPSIDEYFARMKQGGGWETQKGGFQFTDFQFATPIFFWPGLLASGRSGDDRLSTSPLNPHWDTIVLSCYPLFYPLLSSPLVSLPYHSFLSCFSFLNPRRRVRPLHALGWWMEGHLSQVSPRTGRCVCVFAFVWQTSKTEKAAAHDLRNLFVHRGHCARTCTWTPFAIIKLPANQRAPTQSKSNLIFVFVSGWSRHIELKAVGLYFILVLSCSMTLIELKYGAKRWVREAKATMMGWNRVWFVCVHRVRLFVCEGEEKRNGQVEVGVRKKYRRNKSMACVSKGAYPIALCGWVGLVGWVGWWRGCTKGWLVGG